MYVSILYVYVVKIFFFGPLKFFPFRHPVSRDELSLAAGRCTNLICFYVAIRIIPT